MTVLEWDKPGERRYETGVDRGVLYLPEGGAVPWNGLTSVSEKLSREVKSYYLDGIQYLAHQVPGSYSATLQAFTYPDELDELIGTSEYVPGVFVHDQSARIFNLAYRTLVGNEIDGTDHAYKIHLLYNVMATASDRSYETLSGDLSPTPFEWTLVGVPSRIFGIRPTSHISLDSRRLSSAGMETLEEMLYGTNDQPGPPDEETGDPTTIPGLVPAFPPIVDLLTLVETL